MRRLIVSTIALASLLVPSVFFDPIAHSQTIEDVATAAKPSVAAILARHPDGVVSGTGFMAADRVVLTAYHVVEGATQIILKFPDYPAADARVVQADRENDVAALAIPGLPVRPLPLGDVAGLREGQTIVVIGFPRVEALGAETATVTEGIVSAIRPGMIQMQAPISPGNSGGPVLNLRGEVVGIARGILRGQQQGINFATAINAAKLVLGAAVLQTPIQINPSVQSPAPAPSPLPAAAQAERPAWIVGDTWKWREPSGTEATWTVIGVSEDHYSLQSQTPSGKHIVLVPPDSVPVGTDFRFQWPLEVSKQWESDFRGTSANNRGENTWHTVFVVEAYESVTVPAGTFEAFRVRGHQCNVTQQNRCGDFLAWYSPQVKNTVKMSWLTSGYWTNAGRSEELLSYQVH